MAVVDDTRALGGVDVMVSDVGRPVKDAARLVAKAAATLGLPNLLHHARASPSNKLIWQTESCCSCTPLACMTHDTQTRRRREQDQVRPPSDLQNCNNVISSFHGPNCSEIRDSTTNNGVDNERGHLPESVTFEDSEKGNTDVVLEGSQQPRGGEREVSALQQKEQAGTHREEGAHPRNNVSPLTKTFRRRSVADYEKEWTFRPKLNDASLRLASQTARSSLPVSRRLYEQRRRQGRAHHQPRENFTFCPKLNATSLRLAKERSERLPEVQARVSQLAVQRVTEACANYTFCPHLSQQSLRIMQHMEADFQARQQRHLLRRQRTIEEGQSVNYCKRSRPITLPSTSSTPPHGTPSPAHSHPHTTPTPSNGRGRLVYHRPSRSTHTSNCTTRRSPIKSPLKDPASEVKRPKSTPSGRRLPHTTPPTMLSPVRRSHDTTTSTSPLAPEGPWSQLSSTDRVKRVTILAERAVKNKKVFVCRGGYRTIRRCLRERGWVEKEYSATKEPSSPYQMQHHTKTAASRRRRGTGGDRGRGRSRDRGHTSSDSSSDSSDVEGMEGGEGDDIHVDEEEYSMLSRAVRNAEPNFVWTLRRDDSLYRHMLPLTSANHFAKASSFTTKVGLCTNLHSLMWCGQATSDLFFPRCYLLSSNEEKDTFIDDYHFTTALNMLKLAIDQHWGEFKSPNNTYSTNQNIPQHPARPPLKIGTPCPPPKTPERPVVPEEAVELALRACAAYISFRRHDDIEEGRKCLQLKKAEWQALVKHYYKVVLERGELVCSSQTVRKASDMLEELEKYLPQLHMDGVRNIWIVKPGAMSRGRGILCLDRLEPILQLVSSAVHKEGRWVVQKYIERPLLVYGTKFDIRQWFLVTDWNPLTMWMYKDSYLRFATQKFTLDNMNESVHLCNNSIQRNYTNSDSRSDLLPEENMWHSSTFRDYLDSLGEAGQWDQVIYPGMKHALTCAMQVSQDLVESRKSSFELYGADFMLTDDFKPWLIEINCSPTMESSTSVTSQLCTEVMEDTLKVVLDRREDKECSTGKFELAYKQPKFETPSYVGIQLCVEGMAIQQNHTHHHSSSIPVATLSYTNT